MLILAQTALCHSMFAWISNLHLISQAQSSYSIQRHQVNITFVALQVCCMSGAVCELRFRTDAYSASATSKSNQIISKQTSVAMEIFPSFLFPCYLTPGDLYLKAQ